MADNMSTSGIEILYYQAKVDNEEWEVSSVEVDVQKKLRDLKGVLIEENEWGDASKVSFYRNNISKQLALTTKISVILTGNNEENPLLVIVQQQEQGDYGPYVFKRLDTRFEPEDAQTRFRRLAESAAIIVTDTVMKSVVFHFPSQMAVVNTAAQAADLYKRASRIPRSATEIILQENDISVGSIFGGTDTSKSIILEAFENGKPRLLKIAEKESVDHEFFFWETMKERSGGEQSFLVPIRKLCFESEAKVQAGNLSGGFNDVGSYRSGLLMRKYQSTLSRCKIPLAEPVLLRCGEQLKTAISTMHDNGYCHMDIKPANIFLWEDKCLLGDYGGATKIGEPVREHTMAYYPSNAGRHAKPKTDYYLLAVTLLEMFGCVDSPPGAMTVEEITTEIDTVESDNVKAFLSQLVSL